MATKVEITRVVDGRRVPPAGRWAIDPTHSQVQFVARHMMISRVRGSFRDVSGWALIDERPEDSSVEVVIDAASIDTGDPERDGHLRSADFLDVDQYPAITFRSTAVRLGSGDRWNVDGVLTVKSAARPITLDVEFCGASPDPWGNYRAGFLATTDINREDFDITWNQVLETGGFLVGKGVHIEIDVELVLQHDDWRPPPSLLA